MMQYVVAFLLVLHGIAHLVGFLVSWRLANLEEMPYATKLLAGRWDVGDYGIRVVGVLWLLAALCFVASGIAAGMAYPGWLPFVMITTVYSLVLCLLGWPEAKIGIYVNLAILCLGFFVC